MTRVCTHFFFNRDFLQQEVNHCLQTNRPSLLHLRFFKRVICHFKSVSLYPMLGCCGPNSSFTIELLISEPHRRFLSAIQCSLTKTFICWPPSLISIVLRFWKRLFTFQSPMCHCGALILSSGAALNLKVADLLPKVKFIPKPNCGNTPFRVLAKIVDFCWCWLVTDRLGTRNWIFGYT